jgi:hypothetical protein
VKINAGRACAFSLAGLLVGFGVLGAPLQAGAELLTGVGVQTTPSIAITVPALPLPKPPAFTVPTVPVPKPPALKVPALPLPKSPAVKVAAVPVPKPHVVTVPTVPVPKPHAVTVPTVPVPEPSVVEVPSAPIPNSPNGPAGMVPAPTLPQVPSVPSPSLAGGSQAPAQATSIVSGLSRIPTSLVPEVPNITVPTVPLPTPPVVTVPTVPLPTPPVVTVPTVPLPKPPVVTVPTAPIPNSPTGSAGKLPPPTLPKVPSPSLAGVSQAPAQATSTLSGLSRSSSHQGSGSTSTSSAGTVYRADGQAGGALVFLGSGYGGPLLAMEAATTRALGGLSRRDQAALALFSTVRRLEGCLRYLPVNLRRVLELIAGANAPIALSPEALAAQLHVPVSRVSRLERLALRRLRLTARTHTCGAAAAGVGDPFAFNAFAALVGEEGGPAGGVKAARYAKSASGDPVGLPASARSQGGDLPLGLNNLSAEGVGILLILAVLVGLLSIGLLFADSLRPWPIHREWRSRWIHRHPWNRHH